MDDADCFADGGEVEVGAFDHHNLFCREGLLRNESADNHLTDMERIGSLLHGHPQPLVWRRTRRNAIAVSDMLHALLRSGVTDAFRGLGRVIRIEIEALLLGQHYPSDHGNSRLIQEAHSCGSLRAEVENGDRHFSM